MKKINLAIVGATGLVGNMFLKELEEHNNIKINNLFLFASKKSEGKLIKFRNKNYYVEELNLKNIKNKKITHALFSAGKKISKKFIPIFNKLIIVVIDNSSAFRMKKNVPLVVPQINFEDINKNDLVIANPNCSTIQSVLPLKPLHDNFEIKKIIYTTFQAVSGSGVLGINDLKNTTSGFANKFYPHPIFNNCLPHIDNFLNDGYTNEEVKMIKESKKILKLKNVKISATCVRVPIENCHSIDVYVEFKKEINIESVKKLLSNYPSIIVLDDPENNIYPLATIANNTDYVYVGRIRKGNVHKNSLRFFCVADNLRKGAAGNAVEILEMLVK